MGTCGTVSQKLKALDLVFVDHAYYSAADATAFGYAYGQIPRMPKYFESDKQVTNKICKVLPLQNVNLAAADIFISSYQQKEFFLDKLNAEIQVVDMESTAIFQTAFIFAKPIVSLKVISDSVFIKSSAEQFNKTIQQCSIKISETLTEILKLLK
ncbi:5'-methylthioadenosine/S-adenosylhomocysteine nucleosidase [Spiroplasma clarkii]|uniref:5'-methylthioadenosine/S-adenosylhomocysteine nucleosidase family protein n=1 Tax=Spiroplasma clarkii TaxID=2139 RepID=UPI001F1678A1|nr:5'-methylthioadenosine/S-adenosylhomocysteine nucleosidase [Spiroplasma clarkii]